MIIENSVLLTKYISTPKNSGPNCASFVAGLVEGILDGADFVRSLFVRSCMRACVLACLRAFVHVCVRSCMHSCVRALWRASFGLARFV